MKNIILLCLITLNCSRSFNKNLINKGKTTKLLEFILENKDNVSRVSVLKSLDNLLTEVEDTDDFNNLEALETACLTNQLDIIKFLIEKNIPLPKEKISPCTLILLHYYDTFSEEYKRQIYDVMEIVEKMLNRNYEIDLKIQDRKLFYLLVQYFPYPILEKALNIYRLKNNLLEAINSQDKNGETILFYSLKLGKIKTSLKLLEEGASVDIKNNKGDNPSHIFITYLLEKLRSMEIFGPNYELYIDILDKLIKDRYIANLRNYEGKKSLDLLGEDMEEKKQTLNLLLIGKSNKDEYIDKILGRLNRSFSKTNINI